MKPIKDSSEGHKTSPKALIIKLVSVACIAMGMGLIIYTLMAIYIRPDYDIKTDYEAALGAIEHNIALIDENQEEDILPETMETGFVSYDVGALIGSLIIPSLNYELPIYEGTSSKELKKGVGRFITSALPGEIDNCVLSGHRDTVFSKLGELVIGEQIIVKSDLGFFVYEVTETRIVEADDQTVIVPTDVATLTLTTCYPFEYLGFAPQRYIVSAEIAK